MKTALITGVTSQDGSYLAMQIRWEGEGVNEVGYWLNALGWQAQVQLAQGLALAYQDFYSAP